MLGIKAELNKRVDFDDPSTYKDVNWAEVCKDGGCSEGQKKAAAQVAVPTTSVVTGSSTPVTSSASGATSSSGSSGSSDSSSSSGSSSSGGSGSCSDLGSVWKSGDISRRLKEGGYMLDGTNCTGGCTSADGEPYTSFGKETPPAHVGSTDAYRGNVGNAYGHNMLPLTSCDVSSYPYSITFTNADKSQIQVALWNKVGDDYNLADRKQSGASRNAFFKFPLEPGQSAAFAIQENSQIAFSQACERSKITGQWDCTWGEADFGDKNTPNNGRSGYDRSSIANSKGNQGLLSVCVDGHDCSDHVANSFVSDKQTHATGDLMIEAGQPMHVKVTMGG